MLVPPLPHYISIGWNPNQKLSDSMSDINKMEKKNY